MVSFQLNNISFNNWHNHIPSNDEEINWELLSQIQIDLLNQNKAITEIDSLQRNQIMNLITLYPEDPSSSRAKAWLRLASQEDYPLYLPIANKSFGNWDNYSPIAQSEIEDDYVVYPNPAKNQLFISGTFSQTDIVEIEIFDVSGRMLQQKLTSGNSGLFEMKLDDLAVGIYTYRMVINNEIVKSERLIIVK